LLAEVAELYYEDELTQEQIASRLHVSRSSVSRLLKEAKEWRVVEINVHSPLKTATALQERIGRRLDLRECLVLAEPGRSPDHNPAVVTAEGFEDLVAILAARYLQAAITDDTIVGVGWGETVARTVTKRYLRAKTGVRIVQMMGSAGGSHYTDDGAYTASRLAQKLQGTAHYLYAPMVVADRDVREGLQRDPHIRITLDLAQRASVTLVAIEALNDTCAMYKSRYLSDADLEYLQSSGAVGVICGAYVSLSGDVCNVEISQRTIAVDADTMRKVPTRVGLACDPAAAPACVGAARAGLVNVLITDEQTAREVEGILERDTSG
jgi:DNA-binding transcriptional regulator LsrR (DeoR family)